MKAKFLVIVVLAGILAIVGSAVAKGPGIGGQEGRGGPGGDERGPHGDPMMQAVRLMLNDPAIAKEIGMSDEDVKKARDMFTRHRQQMIDMRSRIEKAQGALEDALEPATVDAAAARKAAQEVAAAHSEQIKTRVEHQIELRTIISAEKLQKLRVAVESRRGAFGERGRGRGGFGPPDAQDSTESDGF